MMLFRFLPAGLVIMLLFCSQPGSAQPKVRPAASVKTRHGVYIAPDNCVSAQNTSRRKPVKQVLDESKLAGMFPNVMKPFSKVILNWNSTYDIFLFNDPKQLERDYKFPYKFPAVYSNTGNGIYPSSISENSDLCIGPPGITQNGDTVVINSFGHFVILTDRLDVLRSVMNSTTRVHNVDQAKLKIIIDHNGTVEANGAVDQLDVEVKNNGAADLQKLLVGELADVKVYSNGSAKVNTNGVLKGKRWSPENLQWIGQPTKVDIIQLD